MLLLSTSFIFAESEPKISYNGSLIKFDVLPFDINGRIMAPARQIAETLGAEIEWNSEYGSETNLLADVTTKETTSTYHIKCPEIANILLEKYF